MRVDDVYDLVMKEDGCKSYTYVVFSRLSWRLKRVYARFYWDRDRSNPYVHFIEADGSVGPHYLRGQNVLKRYFSREFAAEFDAITREKERQALEHAKRFDGYWAPRSLPEAKVVRLFGCSSDCRKLDCGGGCSQ